MSDKEVPLFLHFPFWNLNRTERRWYASIICYFTMSFPRERDVVKMAEKCSELSEMARTLLRLKEYSL